MKISPSFSNLGFPSRESSSSRLQALDSIDIEKERRELLIRQRKELRELDELIEAAKKRQEAALLSLRRDYSAQDAEIPETPFHNFSDMDNKMIAHTPFHNISDMDKDSIPTTPDTTESRRRSFGGRMTRSASTPPSVS